MIYLQVRVLRNSIMILFDVKFKFKCDTKLLIKNQQMKINYNQEKCKGSSGGKNEIEGTPNFNSLPKGFSSPVPKKATNQLLVPNKAHLQKSPFTLFLEQELSPLPCPAQLKKIRPSEIIVYKTPEKFLHVTNGLNLHRITEPLNFQCLNFSNKKVRDEDILSENEQQNLEQDNSQECEEETYSEMEIAHKHINTEEALIRKSRDLEEFKQLADQDLDGKKLCCNCKKSRCLKLYCDCFRNNKLCQGCNCVACLNTSSYEQQRYNAMLSLIERNPDAFKPKIEVEKHTKGCNCKKSNCLKKYCQCYQAGLKCNQLCKCEECKNCKLKQSKEIMSTASKSKIKSTIKKEGRFIDWTKEQHAY